jgi:integrase
MPRQLRVPTYCRHKASGQAVARIEGRDHYLGPYGSSESLEQYERLISEWRLGREQTQIPAPGPTSSAALDHAVSISELIKRYRRFAESYYVRDGRPTKELSCMRYALRTVRQLYGSLSAQEFGPLALKGVRQHLIDQGLCRTHINARINRVKRFFKWAVSEELVLSSVHHSLQTVSGLRFGRTTAREKAPVRPAADDAVDATLPFLSPPVAAMVQLQRFTGMRPCEVARMRPCDIDRSGSVWVYEPFEHKNRWRGHTRSIPLGPRAQDTLHPFLDRKPGEFLFSPIEAERWRNEARKRSRRTPMTPSQAQRTAKAKPGRPKRACYDVDSYRRAITYGIIKARKSGIDVAHWHPLQLRHTRATEIRKRFGIEAAQVSLGHARADVTQIYAERNLSLAMDIAGQLG